MSLNLNKKPIDKPEFWKERIDNAVKDHYMVYVTGETDWKLINETHKKIIEKEVSGTVLDCGCGYGRMSELFPGMYNGVDFSPDFIAEAKKRYPKMEKHFQVANLKSLPFEDKTIDWGVCVSIKRMVIDNLGEEEWLQMEKEIGRVCKNVLILEYEVPNEYTTIHLGYEEHKTI